MDKRDLISAILSNNPERVSEAKTVIKEFLTQKSNSFKADATKFVAGSLFESKEGGLVSKEDQIKDHGYDPKVNLKKLDPVTETHTLNGPFSPGTVVTDKLRGKVGVVKINPNNSGHPVVVAFDDKDEANYGPEDIPRLRQASAEDSIPAIVQMLQGKFKDASSLKEGVRKIDQHENGNKKATVHRDSESDEYHVKFHTDGKHHKDADYFTDDKTDAVSTAKHWVNKKD